MIVSLKQMFLKPFQISPEDRQAVASSFLRIRSVHHLNKFVQEFKGVVPWTDFGF